MMKFPMNIWMLILVLGILYFAFAGSPSVHEQFIRLMDTWIYWPRAPQ